MFDAQSRYAACEKAVLSEIRPDGSRRNIHYIRRRFLPGSSGAAAQALCTVRQGDRLDILSARYLGDPLQYWRICDASQATDPDDLEETGRTVQIPLPGL